MIDAAENKKNHINGSGQILKFKEVSKSGGWINPGRNTFKT